MKSFLDGRVTLHGGDCLEVLRTLADASIDSAVTDPPYELGFMGKGWDATGIANRIELWAQVLRVLKPGGHLVAFSGTRTYHRMACAIEDAGFEIRDQIGWAYGSGFPKSHDVSKQIDKSAGAERSEGDLKTNGRGAWNLKMDNHGQGQTGIGHADGSKKVYRETLPATDAAKQWQGWGTALKPAWEPIVLARKPLIGTVAENVLEHGTGAINIDGCRVETAETLGRLNHTTSKFIDSANGSREAHPRTILVDNSGDKGRWAANIIHDGSEEVLAAFPETGDSQASKRGERHGSVYGGGDGPSGPDTFRGHNDSGSAARFFYTAKADGGDRLGSKHPTVKPLDLMQYLVRLVTPKGGTVLDPFAGTGTTGEAAWSEGMRAILIEREEEYQADIARRMDLAVKPTKRAAVAKTKNKLDDPNTLPLFAVEAS